MCWRILFGENAFGGRASHTTHTHTRRPNDGAAQRCFYLLGEVSQDDIVIIRCTNASPFHWNRLGPAGLCLGSLYRSYCQEQDALSSQEPAAQLQRQCAQDFPVAADLARRLPDDLYLASQSVHLGIAIMPSILARGAKVSAWPARHFSAGEVIARADSANGWQTCLDAARDMVLSAGALEEDCRHAQRH